jgi:hypothetical protein
MGEYTEQEIEMLARFSAASDDCKWEDMSDGYRLASVDFVHDSIRESTGHSFAPAIRAAARLMREARDQGAAEMRERAALFMRRNWGNVPAIDDIADDIRALPLKVPQ